VQHHSALLKNFDVVSRMYMVNKMLLDPWSPVLGSTVFAYLQLCHSTLFAGEIFTSKVEKEWPKLLWCKYSISDYMYVC